MLRRANLFFALTLAIVILHAWYYFAKMPETMAIHFARGGIPDGWSSKAAFFQLYLAMAACTVLIFWILPRFLVTLKWPRSPWLPHRNYWLSQEQRPRTLATIGEFLKWYGIINLFFMLIVVQMVFEANLAETPRLPKIFLLSLGLYALFNLAWITALYLRFSDVPSPSEE